MTLSAMDDAGKPVDWWFMYKIAGKGTEGTHKAVGTEYVYFDSNAPADARLALSSNTVDRSGALPSTLDQLYGPDARASTSLGWFFYNDENPITGQVVGSRGHCKGVLAFDLATDTGFWLVQSTPKFPLPTAYSFPTTGMPNAQTLLCVTLASADVAQSIARQMLVAQQPNVYLASAVPQGLAVGDARARLMRNEVAAGNTPVHVVMPFNSRAGLKFMAIAKNPTWGLDFYNDLVGPTLSEDLDVETWEHDPTPPQLDSDKIHTVVDMKAINLEPLGIDISWPEPDDHAKLAISAASETTHFVCVGDLNFTIAQRKRGGGTLAFRCEPLWSSLSAILVDAAPIARASKAAAAA